MRHPLGLEDQFDLTRFPVSQALAVELGRVAHFTPRSIPTTENPPPQVSRHAIEATRNGQRQADGQAGDDGVEPALRLLRHDGFVRVDSQHHGDGCGD